MTALRLSGLSLVLTMGFALPYASAAEYKPTPQQKVESKAAMRASTSVFRAGARSNPVLRASHTRRVALAMGQAAFAGVGIGYATGFATGVATLSADSASAVPAIVVGAAAAIPTAIGTYQVMKASARTETVVQGLKLGVFTLEQANKMAKDGVLLSSWNRPVPYGYGMPLTPTATR